jgi:Tol biopolymer transport system component
VSASSSGGQANGTSAWSAISADGRYVAFFSDAFNLVPGDTNLQTDVFLRDLHTGTTELVSLDSSGAQGNGFSYNPSISVDGRFVAFESHASNLVPGDTNSDWDIFVRDRQSGTTELVSLDSNGVQGNSASLVASISADGSYVAFYSYADNLVQGDTNLKVDVFVRDRLTSTTERVSVSSNGAQGNNVSDTPSISADGRYVAFESLASNLVVGDTNLQGDVFVRDRLTGTTERVSVSSSGLQGNGKSQYPSISADGRYVAFTSSATNLVSADTNGAWDVFVRDRLTGTTTRVSKDSSGVQGNGTSDYPSISSDGRYVLFSSAATNLVAGDTNGVRDIFLRDRQSGTTERVSVASSGVQGDGDSTLFPSISTDGRYVAFMSFAATLAPSDTNNFSDVFVRDREASGFASICDPGSSGVIACPCLNPPGGPGRGCDNSSATGGAALSASGIAYLSSDSLVLTSNGEKPTATSIVMQGDATVLAGLVFGQGVRCVAGTLKRLYTKTAVGGSITAPDFGAGDPTVSARSAALGDAILAGESRWYLVYYRDPNVLGGCSASSTFNATQTGRVDWSP